MTVGKLCSSENFTVSSGNYDRRKIPPDLRKIIAVGKLCWPLIPRTDVSRQKGGEQKTKTNGTKFPDDRPPLPRAPGKTHAVRAGPLTPTISYQNHTLSEKIIQFPIKIISKFIFNMRTHYLVKNHGVLLEHLLLEKALREKTLLEKTLLEGLLQEPPLQEDILSDEQRKFFDDQYSPTLK